MSVSTPPSDTASMQSFTLFIRTFPETSGNDKVVAEAREDAALFVASDGAIRGARLQAALRHLRESGQAAHAASDLQLAQSILAR